MLRASTNQEIQIKSEVSRLELFHICFEEYDQLEILCSYNQIYLKFKILPSCFNGLKIIIVKKSVSMGTSYFLRPMYPSILSKTIFKIFIWQLFLYIANLRHKRVLKACYTILLMGMIAMKQLM